MARVELKNKTAFISGASAGIGYATAKMLAYNGVNIIIASRRIEKLKLMAKEFEAEYKVSVIPIEMDMVDKDNIITAIEKLPSDIKTKISILINNAGFAVPPVAYNEQNVEEVINNVRVNCEGLVVLTHCLIPTIIDSGDGFIVNLGSVASDTPYFGGSIYCATKSFVETFTDALRIEVMDKPVRVCNIKPGLVETEFSVARYKGDKEKAANVYKGLTPLNADNIADTIEYVLTRPANVQIASMTIMASSQGTANQVYRK